MMETYIGKGNPQMLPPAKQFVNLLEKNEIRYQYEGTTKSGKDVLVIRFGGNNMDTISVNFFFSSDGEDAAIRIFNIAKIPEVKIDAIYPTLNELNSRYRFAKFCLDSDDSTLQLEMDTAFRAFSAGDVCYELMLRAVNICDEAYPDLMKALWR